MTIAQMIEQTKRHIDSLEECVGCKRITPCTRFRICQYVVLWLCGTCSELPRWQMCKPVAPDGEILERRAA